MVDLDSVLAQLRDAPTDARLAGLEGAVLDELAARRSGVQALRGPMMGIAACAALLMGVAGAVLPASPVRADDPLMLGAPAGLVPSSLLSTLE